MSRLVPLSPGNIAPINLQRPVLLVGRHPECDVRLDSPKISRRHCCIALAYDRVILKDLGSRNGVRVNGELVDETRLQPGDEIAIGHLIYRLEVLAAPPAPVPLPLPAAAPPPPPPPTPAPAPAPQSPVAPPIDLPALPISDDDLIPLDDDVF